MDPDSTPHGHSVNGASRVPTRSPPPRPSDLDSLLTTSTRTSIDQSRPPSIEPVPLPTQTQRLQKRALPRLSWGGELLAGVISAASLIALITILARQDGQPLSAWTFTFSLNTVASVLSTLFKTPLAYLVGSCIDQSKWVWFTKKAGPLSTFASIDEAGRGPLGCISLLWLLGLGAFRRWVTIGACVTIALLTIDPFLQSVIEYPGKTKTDDRHNATVGVARSFDIGSWYNNGQMYSGGADRDTIIGSCVIPYEDRGMSATTMLGFIDGSTSRLSQPPSVSCATGNCTWAYSTLAICSKCEDVTYLITNETVEPSMIVAGASDPVFHACTFQSYFSGKGNYLRYRLKGKYDLSLCAPEGILEAPGPGIGDPGESGFGRTRKVRLAAGSVSSPQDTYRFNTSDTLLASFAVLQVSDDYWARKTAFNAADATATECSLNLCTQLYEAEMKLGVLTERVLPSTYEREPDSFSELKDPFDPTDNLTWTDEDPGISLARRGPYFPLCGGSGTEDNMTSGGLQVLIERTDLQLHMSHEAEIQVQSTFNITHKAIDTMIYDLKTNLEPRMVDFLSSSSNISQTFDRAARLMSYHMRETTNSSSVTIGETRQWVTYIRVRWEFMLLPIIVAVVVAFFAAGATAQSCRLGLSDVKGDGVSAMLLVDGHTRDMLRIEPRGGRRDDVVRRTFLRLARDEKGLYLENRMFMLPSSGARKLGGHRV